jgi:hypothetical protein
MEAHIRRNELFTVFQSGFRRHQNTTVAVLKVTKDIRSNMEDRQVTVLVLLDFSQIFHMVIHRLLLCKLKNLQNYSDEAARMLVDSCLNSMTHFVRCGETEIQSVEYDEFQAIQTILTKQSMLLESEEISQENPIPQRHDMHIIGSISPRTLKSKNLMNPDNFRVDFSS